MAVFLAALGLFVVAVVFARAFGWPATAPWTKHLETLQLVLTLVGIMIGAVWYFFERPQAAKLELSQEVTALPVAGQRVLILLQVSAKNLGGAALDFKNAPYFIYVEQVTPLTRTPEQEFEPSPPPRTPRKIHMVENWSLLAKISSQDPDATLTSFIEAGETENLYFRTILPCRKDLRIYAVARFRKPKMWFERMRGEPDLYWVKQTYLDLTPQCSPEPPAKAAPGKGRSAR